MDLAGGPVALGGMMMCAALGGWALGRWQGGLVALKDAPVVAGRAVDRSVSLGCVAALSHDSARTAPHVAFAAATPLAEMHAEISAYRQAEQVLADFDDDLAGWRSDPQDLAAACRALGTTHAPCTCGAPGCEAPASLPMVRAVQPSPRSAGFTRV